MASRPAAENEGNFCCTCAGRLSGLQGTYNLTLRCWTGFGASGCEFKRFHSINRHASSSGPSDGPLVQSHTVGTQTSLDGSPSPLHWISRDFRASSYWLDARVCRKTGRARRNSKKCRTTKPGFATFSPIRLNLRDCGSVSFQSNGNA